MDPQGTQPDRSRLVLDQILLLLKARAGPGAGAGPKGLANSPQEVRNQLWRNASLHAVLPGLSAPEVARAVQLGRHDGLLKLESGGLLALSDAGRQRAEGLRPV
jgi:hypothetical protein